MDESFFRSRIDKTVWEYADGRNMVPAPIFEIPENFQSTSLLLAGTSGIRNLSDYKVKKIIDSWAEVLPTLSVEYLWIAPKISQKNFDAIAKMPNLKAL